MKSLKYTSKVKTFENQMNLKEKQRNEDEFMTGIICGTGSYIPACTLDNHDIARMVETSDEWIQERTGIKRRHIIENETTTSMAAEAGKRAIEDAGMDVDAIDMILVATISSNMIFPCTACEVQRILGARNAVCFDLNAACSGFIFAYNTAMAYIASGIYKNILVIGSESLSNLTDWTDRGTCILFGDGAGAVVIKASEGRNYKMIAGSEGQKGEALTCMSRHGKNWKEVPESETCMKMDGRAVFQFAVRKVPQAIEQVLEANELKTEEIDYFILHQANKRIVEAVAKRLKEPIEKFPMNLQEYGNTCAATIPVLLDELKKDGTLKPGQKLVIAGFGAGLSWGASVLEWEG